MLRTASRPLARYSTIRRRPAHIAGTRLYSLDSSHHVTEGIKTEGTPEPGPSNEPSPNSNDEVSSTTSAKKSRRVKKLKPKGLPIQEQIISGSSFTQIRMESAASEPTLEDLLALKPANLPDTTKFDYPERYRKLYEKTSRIINRSFTEDQIYGFLKELDPKIQSLPRTKAASISFLINNHWNMHPPQAAPLKDRKPRTEEIILNPERLVVLLGKNGGGLRALATQLKVKIRPLPKQFGIEVTGRPEQISAVRSHLNQIRRKTIQRSVKLPLQHGVRPELLQEISKRSGAYVQAEGAEKIEVSADSVAKYQSAARLINRACFDEADAKQVPLLVNLNTSIPPPAAEPVASTESYAAFPFLSSQALPWTAGHSAIRVRRVGGLLSTTESNDSDWSSQVWSLDGTQENVKSVLLDNLPPRPKGYIRSLRARTGHVLTSTRQSLGLSPLTPASTSPLAPFNEILDQDTRTFVHFSSPTEIGPVKSQRKYRLVYQGGLSPVEGGALPSKSDLRSQVVVDFTQPCPDRALDMSFTAFDHKVLLLEDVPQILKKFAKKLPESFEKLDEIPLPDGLSSIVLNDSTYYLQSSSLVQVNTSSHGNDSEALVEFITDLDSRSVTTTTLCVGLNTDAGWTTFMEECKKALARPFYRPQAKFVPYRPALVDE
ncbi:hypothetical protein FRC04_007779 [Tulasnella sp. 424]|nr:hypothetical protein FRC04_007779 [Tulasnella sp. 424]